MQAPPTLRGQRSRKGRAPLMWATSQGTRVGRGTNTFRPIQSPRKELGGPSAQGVRVRRRLTDRECLNEWSAPDTLLENDGRRGNTRSPCSVPPTQCDCHRPKHESKAKVRRRRVGSGCRVCAPRVDKALAFSLKLDEAIYTNSRISHILTNNKRSNVNMSAPKLGNRRRLVHTSCDELDEHDQANARGTTEAASADAVHASAALAWQSGPLRAETPRKAGKKTQFLQLCSDWNGGSIISRHVKETRNLEFEKQTNDERKPQPQKPGKPQAQLADT